MNKVKHLPKTIPSRDHEFSIDVQGSLTNENYKGDFKSKIPRLREQALIAKEKALMNAGFDATLDKQIKNLHHMVAYLKHSITDAPAWFYETDFGYDLYDTNVVEEIYHAVLEKEESWLESVWGKEENESEETE